MRIQTETRIRLELSKAEAEDLRDLLYIITKEDLADRLLSYKTENPINIIRNHLGDSKLETLKIMRNSLGKVLEKK